MATRKIKTNKNKKTFRRTRSKQHRGGSGKKRPINEVYPYSNNGTPVTHSADGLSDLDRILLEGKVGDKVEVISHGQQELWEEV